MGLKGNLTTVNLADVFQVLSRGNSNGLLRIQAPEGPRFVEIQNGAISIAGRSAERIMLGDLLLSRGLLDEAKLEQALNVQKESGKLLGQVLLDQNHVTMEQLEEALRFQVEEEVCELFMLRSGDFDFLVNATLDAKIAPGGGLVRLKIDPNSLLIEAARRADEWKAIEQRLASQSFLFQLTVVGQQALHTAEGISPEGAILLRLVLAQRTVESMVQKACLGRLTTNQMLLELMDAGMIEPMPFSSYEKVAREHLRLRRVEESARIANFALEAAEPEYKERAQLVLADIDKARKLMAQASSVKVSTDPKVRSEVIRRNQPNLMLKKESSAGPMYAGLAVVFLAVIGVGVYLIYFNEERDSKKVRDEFERVKADAADLVRDKKYPEALDLLRGYKTWDPDITKQLNEHFEKVQKDIEAALLQAAIAFDSAYPGGKPDQQRAAADELERFRPVSVSNPQILVERDKAFEKLARYRTDMRAADAKQAFRKLMQTPSNGEAREKEFAEYLAKGVPEDTAVLAREEISRLQKARIDSTRYLKEADELGKKRDLERAKLLYEQVKKDYPNSEIAKKAEAALAKIAEDVATAQEALKKAEATKPADATRKALTDFLASNPPQQFASGALGQLCALIPEDSEAPLRAAVQAAQSAPPAEARQKLLEILAKNPFSRTARDLKLKVSVRSDPAGIDVCLPGQQPAKTPTVISVPAVDPFTLTFKKQGFQDHEVAECNFRGDTIDVALIKKDAGSRRMPYPALSGMALVDEHLVVGGASELTICSRADLKVVLRQPLNKTITAEPRLALCSIPGHVLVGTASKTLTRVKVPMGGLQEAGLDDAALCTPTVFKVQDAQLVGLQTAVGFQSFQLADLKLFKSAALGEAVTASFGAAFDGEQFFFGRDKNLVAVDASDGQPRWSATATAKLAGPPAWHANAAVVGVLGVDGKLATFEKEKGEARSSYDFKKEPLGGCVAAGDGFAALLTDSRLEMGSAKDGKMLWSLTLAGKPVMPPVLVGDKIAAGTSQGDDHYLYLVSDKGAVVWRALLYAKAVSVAADSKRLYVSTEDGEVTAYDLQ